MPAIILGVLINIPGEWISSISGIALVLFIYIPIYIMGAVAAGDVKVLMAVGAIMGHKLVLLGILFIIVFNLIITMIILARKGKLREVLIHTYNEIKYRALVFILLKRKIVLDKPSIKAETFIPYMPSVAIGINAAIIIDALIWI